MIQWLFLGFLLLSPQAHAVAPVPAQGVVGNVQVQGTRRIEEAAVLANVGLRRGDTLNPGEDPP